MTHRFLLLVLMTALSAATMAQPKIVRKGSSAHILTNGRHMLIKTDLKVVLLWFGAWKNSMSY